MTVDKNLHPRQSPFFIIITEFYKKGRMQDNFFYQNRQKGPKTPIERPWG